MIRIDLNPDEAGMLKEILELYLSDLRMEIGSTERMTFREEMKKREELLKRLIKHLEEGGV